VTTTDNEKLSSQKALVQLFNSMQRSELAEVIATLSDSAVFTSGSLMLLLL